MKQGDKLSPAANEEEKRRQACERKRRQREREKHDIWHIVRLPVSYWQLDMLLNLSLFDDHYDSDDPDKVAEVIFKFLTRKLKKLNDPRHA